MPPVPLRLKRRPGARRENIVSQQRTTRITMSPGHRPLPILRNSSWTVNQNGCREEGNMFLTLFVRNVPRTLQVHVVSQAPRQMSETLCMCTEQSSRDIALATHTPPWWCLAVQIHWDCVIDKKNQTVKRTYTYARYWIFTIHSNTKLTSHVLAHLRQG